jgi:hypothetical protein
VAVSPSASGECRRTHSVRASPVCRSSRSGRNQLQSLQRLRSITSRRHNYPLIPFCADLRRISGSLFLPMPRCQVRLLLLLALRPRAGFLRRRAARQRMSAVGANCAAVFAGLRPTHWLFLAGIASAANLRFWTWHAYSGFRLRLHLGCPGVVGEGGEEAFTSTAGFIGDTECGAGCRGG